MKFWKPFALVCMFALATSTVANDAGEEDYGSGSGGSYEGSEAGNRTNGTDGDVPSGGGGGVPSPSSAAEGVTWQTTVLAFSATAVAAALV